MTAVMTTNRAVLERYQIDASGIEHLDLKIPFLTDTQRQGDVLILLLGEARGVVGELVPAKGVTVVKGETSGGNSHILHAFDGECYWVPAPSAATDQVQGWITVPEGSKATLVHTSEHNVLGIGPGDYEVRRQREFAGEWRRVSD